VRPKFSLCYTSARPQAVEPALKRWLERTAHPEQVEVVLSYDRGNAAMAHACAAVKGARVVENTGPANCVAGWNAAAQAATGDVLIMLADDWLPLNRWDEALVHCAPDGWWMKEHEVWITDGYNTDLLTLTIITRRRYERFGYVFYPGYKSLFSDTEHTALAKADHVIIDARNLLFEHLHPDCKKRQRDEVDLVHASADRWRFGEDLFNFRRELGFPLDDGPVAAAYAAKPVRYAVVVQAIRDDLCLKEVCQRLIDEGMKLSLGTELHDQILAIFIFTPDTRWDGVPADTADVARVAEIARELQDANPAGLIVHHVPFKVADVANLKQSRIMVETDCRNWYQRYCAQQGFDHCIIADGDELWRPGLLAQLNELVRERWPMSVYTGMVPVAGLPGYPIEGALDKATIYARADATFQECRGAYGYRHEIVGHDIFHFSATRRTLKEIADKHLGSGHADDPRYAMQVWCDEVLMKGKLVPGFCGAHMFKDGNSPNVWPLIRKFKPDEWAELPDTIKLYLGAP
jgi:hypothetical protein